jgi:predicted ester cyclase
MKLLADQPQLSAVFIKINTERTGQLCGQSSKEEGERTRFFRVIFSKLLADKIIAVFAQLQK